jgi:hypothetical protein
VIGLFFIAAFEAVPCANNMDARVSLARPTTANKKSWEPSSNISMAISLVCFLAALHSRAQHSLLIVETWHMQTPSDEQSATRNHPSGSDCFPANQSFKCSLPLVDPAVADESLIAP